MTTETYSIDLPTWSLCALINGDESGLYGDDIEHLKSWTEAMTAECKKMGASHWDISLEDEPSPYFTRSPEFGPACECESAEVVFFFDA